MGFLIEILSDNKRNSPAKRDLIAEDELMKTHSKDMYNFLKSTLRYELKVPVKKSQMLRSDFDQYLKEINNGHIPPAAQIQGDGKGTAAPTDTLEENSDQEGSADKNASEGEIDEDNPETKENAMVEPEDASEGETGAAEDNKAAKVKKEVAVESDKGEES